MCKCYNCSNTLKDAIPIRTQRIRVCLHCGKENSWPLDEGQKPIGYNVDEDFKEEVSNELDT
jgi:hypothetical protein